MLTGELKSQIDRIWDVFYDFKRLFSISEKGRQMALSIKHPEADRLARELAKRTGEGLTEAVIKALRERLARQKGRRHGRRLSEELRVIGERCAALPVLDRRTPDEILGYDENGLPR